jgi:ABC-type multidrug transport system ATPase subunit
MDESAIPGGVETETQVHGRVRVRPAIRVAGVTKRFGNNNALDGMSFAARTGEITALLGHNGAGKTTTFGVLTGSVLPDAGAAWINGVDVSCNQTKAHATLGVCPQFDVLWPSLTVREHLELFASFRPLRGAVAANSTSAADSSTCAAAYKDVVRLEIEKKLVAVGLMDDAERPAGTLSGGQRRKLSLAIAFIGDPDVVLLDEPTAGMDPLSRRHAWDVIRGLAGRSDVATSGDDTKECGADFSAANSPPTRKATSVLLTTHFMDEADALSDRVCVVHGGRLAAAGSPLFVKTAFGGGYSLRVRCVTATIDSESTEIFQLVTAAVPGATLARVETPPGRSDSSQKKEVILCFNLPSCATQHFPKALRALESAAGKQVRPCAFPKSRHAVCPYSYQKGLLPLPIVQSNYSYTLRKTDTFFCLS